ncbi:Vesicular transport protein, partial [Spraguea lophii 42_110]
MLFFSQKKEDVTMEGLLFTLNDRLSSSVYLEDKLDSLEEIYRLSISYPFSVGIHSLEYILNSVEIKRPIQYKILNNIFQSHDGDEFIDISFKNENDIKNILDNYINDIHYLSTINYLSKNITKLSLIALKSDVFMQNIKNLTKINIIILIMLSKDNFFKEQIVVECILETILNRIDILLDQKKEYERIKKTDKEQKTRKKVKINNIVIEKYINNTNLHNLILLMIQIIKDSRKNHKYFIELNFKRIIDKILEYDKEIFFQLLIVILNERSNNIKILQEYFM